MFISLCIIRYHVYFTVYYKISCLFHYVLQDIMFISLGIKIYHVYLTMYYKISCLFHYVL